MAITALGPFCIPATFPMNYAGPPGFTSTTVLLDAADEAAGYVFRAPRTGTITAIGWATRTVTTGATLDVRLETVSGGFPSGTLKGTNTNGAQVVADGDDTTGFETALTAGASVTIGDRLAVVIKNPSSSFGNMQIANFIDDYGVGGCLYTTSWAATNTAPIFYVVYSDAPTHVHIPGVWPIKSTITTTAVSTSTTPDVFGLRFQVPVAMRIVGAWVWMESDGDANVRLVSTSYNQGAGTGILATGEVLTADDMTTNASLRYVAFTAAVDLVAETNYRLVVEPSSGTSVNVYDFNLVSLASLDAWAGQNFHLTTAKDPTADGSWTNYNSGTFRMPFIWPVFDGVDVSAAAGGLLTHPGMLGGMRG